MNYYLDTEFIEDFTTPIFGHRQHYVDLISIGIVAEDGREYYAVSKDFDLKHVWNKYDLLNPLEFGGEPEKVYWLRENVLKPIWKDLRKNVTGFGKDHTVAHESFSYKNLKTLIQWYGKTNKQIAEDIQCFTAGATQVNGFITMQQDEYDNQANINVINPPTFYGYYADYDWVVFCSLFGRMLDLPKGYPMYCRDLKQVMDVFLLDKTWKDKHVPGDNEHHALADARWNRKLHQELLKHVDLLISFRTPNETYKDLSY